MAKNTTKAQFLLDLADINVVDLVGTPVEDTDQLQFGDKKYRVSVRKVSSNGKSLNYESIIFIVVDEGGPNESAYFYKISDVEFDNKQEKGEIVI